MSEKNVNDSVNEEIFSPLRMEHVVVNKMYFERKNFAQKESEIRFRAHKDVERIDAGKYCATLGIVAEKENEYVTEVEISGYFLIDEDHPSKDVLLQKNTIAILFPFVRTQLTLLTSQPETMPIVLPTMNINNMFKD